MEQQNDLFNLILDKDETIKKIIKPNKIRFTFISLLPTFIFFLIALILFIVLLSLSLTDVINFDDGIWPLLGILCFIFLFFIFQLIVVFTMYKKTFYAYTNKRLIIRSGFIGVDYKTLDFNMIGSINVNVSLLDKLVKNNTGTISFGSMSSPMINNGNARSMSFSFVSIDNPYIMYKEIKEIIDEVKKGNN